MFKSKFFKAYGMPLILLISILIGTILGVVMDDTSIIKPFGDIFLNLMYTIVVPLVFFTISSSIANMVNLKRLGKILKNVFIVFVITSLISSIFMLFGLSIFDIGKGLNITLTAGSEVEKLSLGSQIVKALTVTDFSNILSRSNMLPLIVFSILFGISVALIGDKCNNIKNALDSLSLVMMKIVKIIMYYAPIGLCAYFANLVNEFGPELIGSYAKTMIFYYVICIVYFLIFYTLYAYIANRKKGVKSFYKNVFTVVLTSLATQSSLATLPTNLEVTKEIGVPKDIREVTLPIGTTMHMEGSSMGAILKIAFLFAIFNKPFTGFGTHLTAILIAVLASVVMSGIPGGGLIGEMLIVSMYSFPLEAFPIIATIGWLIDPPATCINVCGDTASSMLITKLVDKKLETT